MVLLRGLNLAEAQQVMQRLLESGWDVYVCDAVERGRAGWSRWPEIYQQLIETISSTGGKVLETIGGFCKQLEAVVVANGVTRDVRFIGFDGPRWFLRGAITGPALVDANAAMNMEDIFRSLVIDRGTVPLPPREPLPLKVPDGNFVPPKFGI